MMDKLSQSAVPHCRAGILHAPLRVILKWVLISGICLAASMPTLSAAPAYVTGNINTCTATSCTDSVTGTNAGDTIVLGVFVMDSTAVSSINDSLGNTYTPITSSPWTGGDGNTHYEYLYYAKNTNGGADTITVSLSGSVYTELRAYDYSGLDPSSPVDVSATPATGNSTSPASGSLTTTNPNDLLFGYFHNWSPATITPEAGFTGRSLPGDGGPSGEDENVTSTGTYSASMSYSSSSTYVAFFVAFKAASRGGSGPAYVTGNTNACTATSCTASLNGTNAGDTIILGVFVVNSTSVSSVMDSQGNTFTPINSQTWSSHNYVERLYYAKNIKGGADTITLTLAGSAYMELHSYDYSGLDTSSPLDVSATPATGTGTSGTISGLTTTNANDLLFAFFHSDNSVNDTAGTGFTGRTPPIDTTPLGEDENVTSTGTYSATMSFSGSADYVAFFVAFKAASSGGSGPAYVTSADSGGTATSWSATLTGTHAGDLIVMGLYVSDSTSVNSVMDSQGNQFIPIGSQTWSPSNYVERLYYAKNIVGGSDTITVTLAGSATLELLPYDYSGLDTSSPLDVSATPATGTGTSGAITGLTTTNANDLLFAFFNSDGDVNNTAGTGFTGRLPAGDTYPMGEDENVTSTGTYSATMSFSASADYVAFFVAFKAASGGGSGGTVANPSISPVSGTYSSPQTITVSDSTSGATICVRTDGGTPTASTPGTCNSPATGYSSGGMFSLTIPSGGATVEALGTLAGDTNSGVVTNTYSLAPAAASPSFSPAGGTYTSAQTVTISTASGGSVICWSTAGTPATNGASGCTTGTLYSSPVTVSASETLHAVAGGTGYSDSTPASASYTLNLGPQVYYYTEDSLGTTRVMTDSSGTVCFDADYYPYGGEHDVVTNCQQNYKFEGKERDSETGNDDFGARYYSNRLGRWLSADWSAIPEPVPYANLTNPQTLNLYAMVSDNPETFADLDGHLPYISAEQENPNQSIEEENQQFGDNYAAPKQPGWQTSADEQQQNQDQAQHHTDCHCGTNRQFKTANQAATAALEAIFTTAEKQHVEYGGRIYRNANGTYSYTIAVTQHKATAVDLDAGGREGSRVPLGATNAGMYHTHEMTTGGFQEGFSYADAAAAVREHVPSYIETPSGLIHEINGSHATSYLTAPQYTWRVNGPIP